MPQGRYLYTMISTAGGIIDKRTFIYDGESSWISFSMPAIVHKGVYFITISTNDYKRTEKVIVE